MRIQLFFILAILVLFSCKKEDKSSVQNNNNTTDFKDAPDWAKEVVWYQIFVERFRNGDPSNDPTKESIYGFDSYETPESWAITPWTQDWYKPDAYFKEVEAQTDAEGKPIIRDFNSKAQLRRYGGDLQGVLDKIPYLKELGVTAVYFNPLNDAPSLHKYDPRYWRHIDVHFGPDPKGDLEIIASETHDDPSTWKMTAADKMFLDVVNKLHENGIRVILDYSWNHTGTNFWAWQDVLENQEQSKYKDWYWVESFDKPETEENEFKYRGWAGVQSLPEIKETNQLESHLVVKAFDGNVESDAAKNHIFNVTKRWLDPNGDGDSSDGIDGYRLDVAAEMPLGFWKEFRQVVRETNPDAFLVGELWWEEWPDKLLDPVDFLKGDIFDAPMNYRWYRAARYFFNDTPLKISPSQFVDSLKFYQHNLRETNNYAMMNLTASHDVPRFSTSMFNNNKYKYFTNPGGDNNYKIHKPDAATYQKMKLLLGQQFTYIGAPHIWAGDEMGMWGADDPSTRKPLIWKDYDFENETHHPLGFERPTDKVKFDDELFAYYQKLIQLRKEKPVLVHGDINYLLADDEKNVLAYSRFDDENEVIYIVNNSDSEQTVEINATKNQYKDYFSNESFQKNGEVLSLSIPAKKAMVLLE